MEWLFCGTTYEMSADWWQVWAAFIQAVLSAGAVWAAVALQDRSVEKREKAAEAERWEAVALVARYALATYQTASARFRDEMHPNEFDDLYEHGDFEPAKKAIDDIEAPHLGELELVNLWLDFEKAWRAAYGRIELLTNVVANARKSSVIVNAASLMGDRGTTLFNKAAGVERHVAALVGRPAKL